MAASYISVPRDLTKVKSKVMFNLTKRQLICFGMAVLIGVPSFFLMKTVMKTNTAVMGMMVIMMPFFFLAMYEKNGQPLEVILNHMIQAIFKRPKIRPYKTDNYYAEDDDIRQVEADYVALETALQNKVDSIETDYPGYDEYNYSLSEISHNPFELAALLTVLYENYTPSEVQSKLQTIFDYQYTLTLRVPYCPMQQLSYWFIIIRPADWFRVWKISV